MLFVLAVIPIMILSSHHEIFFVLMAAILLVSSIRSLHKGLSGSDGGSPEADGDLEEEFEEIMNIDMEKFGTGIDVAKSLIIILFLVYCAFYLNSLLFKVLSALAILLQVSFISKNVKEKYDMPRIQGISHLFSSALNLVVILFTLLNKLIGSRF